MNNTEMLIGVVALLAVAGAAGYVLGGVFVWVWRRSPWYPWKWWEG